MVRKNNLQTLYKDLKNLENVRIPNVHFGSSKLEAVEQIPLEKQSKIKKTLWNMLKKTGYKLGDYADYSVKALLSVSIKTIGKWVLLALAIKYREPILKKLLSKKDKETYDTVSTTVSNCVGGVCTNVGKGARIAGNILNN